MKIRDREFRVILPERQSFLNILLMNTAEQHTHLGDPNIHDFAVTVRDSSPIYFEDYFIGDNPMTDLSQMIITHKLLVLQEQSLLDNYVGLLVKSDAECELFRMSPITGMQHYWNVLMMRRDDRYLLEMVNVEVARRASFIRRNVSEKAKLTPRYERRLEVQVF